MCHSCTELRFFLILKSHANLCWLPYLYSESRRSIFLIFACWVSGVLCLRFSKFHLFYSAILSFRFLCIANNARNYLLYASINSYDHPMKPTENSKMLLSTSRFRYAWNGEIKLHQTVTLWIYLCSDWITSCTNIVLLLVYHVTLKLPASTFLVLILASTGKWFETTQ